MCKLSQFFMASATFQALLKTSVCAMPCARQMSSGCPPAKHQIEAFFPPPPICCFLIPCKRGLKTQCRCQKEREPILQALFVQCGPNRLNVSLIFFLVLLMWKQILSDFSSSSVLFQTRFFSGCFQHKHNNGGEIADI